MDIDASFHMRARRLPCGCPSALMWVPAGSHVGARRLSYTCPPAPNCLPALVRAVHNEIKGCKKMGNSSAGFFDVSESWPTYSESQMEITKNGFRGAFFEKQSQKFWRFFWKSYLCGVKRLEIIILSILLLLSTSGVSVNQHFCGGELIAVSVNDFTVFQPTNMNMPDCESGDGCGQCHNKHFHKQIHDSLCSAHSPQIVVKSFSADWFHANLFPPFFYSFRLLASFGDDSEAGFSWLSDYHPPYLLPPHGVRGAPALLN